MTDIFGTSYPDNGIWSTGPVGLEDPNKILHQDIRDAREYRADLKKLKRRGLSGGALASVTTLEAAQQALGETPAELRETSRLFRIRQRLAHAAGADLGDDIYGKRLDQSNRHLDKIKDHTAGIRQDIHQLNDHLKHLRHEQQVAEARQAKAAAKRAKEHAAAVAAGINGAASTAAKRRVPK
jgi:paraquat-inducible protein B